MGDGVCGDGVVDQTEACDDGNATEGDGCDTNCTLSGCGNGITDLLEACDDGNTDNGDGCDNNCMQTFCGNGIKTEDEQCDDGNQVNGDGCDLNCTMSGCGNGVMSGTEACDDGNAVEGDGCDSNCTISACGNGIMGGGESCDDSNTDNADGCSASCNLETAEIEPNEDGSISTGGSDIDGNDFATENAHTNGAITGSTTILAALTPEGDEDVFEIENTGTAAMRLRFDMWNLASGYGIGVSCGTSIDPGLTIRNAAGDALVENNDRTDNDWCPSLVYGILPGQVLYAHVVDYYDSEAIDSYALDVVFEPVVCGDADVGPGEQCDDGNTANADGCSDTCQIEGAMAEAEPNEDGTPSTGGSGTEGNDFGSSYPDANGAITGSTTVVASISPTGDEDVFAITNTSTVATTVALDVWNLGTGYGIGVPCGESIDTGMHVRDAGGDSIDSNDDRSSSADRCSTLDVDLFPGETRYVHVVEYGDDDMIGTYALQIVYTPVTCGDGIVGAGETCDDMNTTPGDGCDASCQIEPVCGDGVLQPTEQCDDTNTMAGDGCSDTCQLEGAVTEIEPNEDGSVSSGGTGTDGNDFGSTNPDANGAFSDSVMIAAAMSPLGDEDVFAFTNPGLAYVSVQFDVWNLAPGYGVGVPCETAIDTGMHIRDAAGNSLADNDDRDGADDRCSSLAFGIAPGETVYAHVVDFGDDDVIASYALAATYSPVVCGDGTVGPGESCDDTNTTPGDGCDDMCQIETICGDGIIEPGEHCDDSNTTPGDGCSDVCRFEGIVAVDEIEPNGTMTAADATGIDLTGDATVVATMGTLNDVDLFKVTVATPTVVRFETFTSPGDCDADTAFDLRVLDTMNTELAADFGGTGIADCGAIVTHLAAGTYYIEVTESTGELVPIYLLEASFQDDVGTETEPNEDTTTASGNLSGENESFVFGDHLINTDSDVYAIVVPPGAAIRAEVIEGDAATANCDDFNVDSRLTLLDENGTELVDDDDDGRGFCSMVDGTGSVPLDMAARNTSATDKTFYLQVRASTFAQASTDGQFVYRLQITLR